VWTAIYYLLFARYYLSGTVVHGSDTHGVWTVPYLAFYSIGRFHEFPWWDPTGLNGWPIYAYLLNWSFNYFNPFSALYLLLYTAITFFVNVDPRTINTFIVFQKTIYYFVLNLLAVVLISRELLQQLLARALTPLIFTLAAVQFQGFRDSHQFEALPGPLFYLFGLIYLDRRRTLRSLYVFILFTGLFLVSASYAVTLSSFYWTVLFTVLLVVFDPSLLRAVAQLLREAWAPRLGRPALVGGVLFMVAGLAAPVTSAALNVGHLMRISGFRPLDYKAGLFGDWAPPDFGTPAFEIWANFTYFTPFPQVHDLLLKYDPWNSGIDHRYVGLAAVPLVLTALVLGFRRRYLLPLFLTFFLCTAFINYTINNVAFAALMKLRFFQNVRTMPGLLARDGGVLLLIFLGSIGFDRLLATRDEQTRDASEGPPEERGLRYTLAATLGVLMLAALVSLALVLAPPAAGLRHTFAHVGVYLGLFSLLCLLLLIVRDAGTKRILALVFLVLVFTDLTISSSYYFLRRPGYMDYQNSGSWSKPRPRSIAPITQEADNWAGDYRGIFHNLAGGPWVGLREWLVLATRPGMATLVENWDQKALTMRAYPHFRFFTNGRFIPFMRIKTIDSIETPARPGDWFYLHDAALVQSKPGTSRPLDAEWRITDFTLNRVRVDVIMPAHGFMVYYDNDDPFFRAQVNGTRVPIHRANFTYKAIALPPGHHVVEWSYNPYPVKIAWTVFYVSFLAYAFLWWRVARSGNLLFRAGAGDGSSLYVTSQVSLE